jgi:hypothetical protein
MLAAVNGTTAPNLIGIVSLGFRSKHVSQLFDRRELLDFDKRASQFFSWGTTAIIRTMVF